MLWKATEWESGAGGSWYIGCVEDLGHDSGYWYHACCILEISGDKFVEMLINDFHVDYISYNKEKDVLVYKWNSLEKARKYKNFINKKAREKNYQI